MQHPDGPDLYASVTVVAEIDPDVVTAAMGVPPSHTARRGQAARPGGPPAKQTLWLWRMEAIKSYDATPTLQAMVDWLETRISALDDLRRDHHQLSVTVTLVAYIDPMRQAVPSVCLEPQMLLQLSRLNVEVEFDFNLLASGR